MGDHMGVKIAKRNTFLIDPQGKIVQVWTGVNPSQHSQQVLAALNGFEKKVTALRRCYRPQSTDAPYLSAHFTPAAGNCELDLHLDGPNNFRDRPVVLC